MDDNEEVDYDLVLPFVTVASRGGPHEDNSYVAGFEIGRLDIILTLFEGMFMAAKLILVIHSENQKQADLIAMRNGWKVDFEPSEVEGWSYMNLIRGDWPED